MHNVGIEETQTKSQSSNGKKISVKEEIKETLVCPISLSLISGNCNVISCMWNLEGKCGHSAEISELDLGEKKGLNVNDSLLEVRRAKTNIIKIMVLDKYLDYVVTNNPIKTKIEKRLHKSNFIKDAKIKSKTNNDVFALSTFHFCIACKKSVFANFLEEHKELNKYKLAMLMGLRESALSKVDQRFKKLSTRRGNKKSKPKIKGTKNV